MLIKRLMAFWKFAWNLLGAQMQLKQVAGLFSHKGDRDSSISAFLQMLGLKLASLLKPASF